MTEKILYIIRGVPGSGKSTLANKLTPNVVEADQFMYVNGEYKWSPNKLNYAHSACRHKVEDYMIEGRDKIAVANTFIKRKDVKPYLDLAEEYGYKVEQRICRGNYQNIHNVPQETVEKMRSHFQESLQLNEGIEEIKKYFPKLSDEQLKEIIALDPTYKGGEQLGQYSKWIIRLIYNNIKNIEIQNQYQELLKRFPDGINPKTGQKFQAPKLLPEIKDEDRYKIKNTLKLYDTLKKEIKQPIDSFKSLGELDKAIYQVQQKGVPTDELALARYNLFQKAVKKGLKIVFEDDKWIVGIPTTKESSCMFGNDTKWCTTSPNGQQYENYTKDGPLYINLNKENGELFQFHFKTGSFMDESDSSVSFTETIEKDDKLKSFYYNDVFKISEILSSPEKLSKYFQGLKNIHIDDKFITGTISFDDIDCYESYRHSDLISLDFISNVLSGDGMDAFMDNDYSSSLEDVGIYYCKKWKEYIAPLNISWDDIVKISQMDDYFSDDDLELDNLSKDDIEYIQSLLEEFDIYDGEDIYSAIVHAYENGSYDEMYKDIISQIKDNLPVDESQPITDDGDLNIKISFEDAEKILPECIGDGYYDSDISFLGYWRLNHNMEDSFGMYEPRYGWYSFDQDYWDECLKSFADKIKENIISVDDKTHKEINEVLRLAGVQLNESFFITDNGEQIFYTKSDSIARLNNEKLDEMAYPTNFNLEQFSQLPSFAARVRYCNERLQKMGVGSSRIAYKVDDEKVLKIAKNNKGITQNVAECDWSRNEYECFAKIFEADTDNYTWVEMEIARKAKRSDFKKILGITFEELVDIIYAMYNQYAYNGRQIMAWMFNTSKENADKLLEELVYSEKNAYLNDLYNYMSNYQPTMVQDWSRIVNWGVVNRNGQELPVIIDTGVTDAVYNEYNRR